jgi:hypothetical protein
MPNCVVGAGGGIRTPTTVETSPAIPFLSQEVEFSSEEHLNAPDSGEYRLEADKSGRLALGRNFNQDFSSERFEVQLEAQM